MFSPLHSSFLLKVLNLTALVFVAHSTAFTQTTAAVQGLITDPNGAAIPGARITLIDNATAATRVTNTREDGFYLIAALPIGDYRARIQAPGFSIAGPLLLGRGAVGGYVVDLESCATSTAQVALRIANGTPASEIAVTTITSRPVFDWRQLQRWGIDEQRLPVGSEIRFKQPSFWQLYKGRIIGAWAVFLVETLLIALLLVERSRRRRASRGLNESEERNNAILRALPDLMFIQDMNGNYLDYHAGDPGILPLSPEELIGKNPYEVLPPNIADSFFECLHLVKTSNEPQSLDYKLTMDGIERCFEARITRCNGSRILSIVRDVTQRKRAEEALREREEFNRQIVESSMDCIKVLDLEGKLLYMSPNGQRMLEITDITALLNTSWIELWPRESQSVAAAAISEARLGRAGKFQAFAPTMRGKARWWDNVITPVKGASGNIESLLAVSRDITAQKRAAMAVRESEERFAKAFKANPQPMSLTTFEEGCYVDVNESFLQMSGYRYDEVIGYTSRELKVWREPRERAQFLEGLKEGSSICNKETRFRTKSGEIRVLLSSAELIELGGCRCILIASSDITERKILEESIRLREREFATLVQNSPDLIARLDKHLRYVYVSPTVERHAGVGAEFLIGRTPSQIGPPGQNLSQLEKACSEALVTRKNVTRDFVFSDRSYWTRVIPEFSVSGEVESLMTISQDVTERLRVEKELALLTEKVFHLQDEERRRIARELHDGTAQNLFAISINLARLKQVWPSTDTQSRKLIEECANLGEETLQEIRTISYLLHPPLLDQVGLVSALQWYVDGFSKRSGIFVDLSAQPVGRLPSEIETALFRIVQEGLTNVRRHSASDTASIRLEQKSDRIILEIRDRGRGLGARNAALSKDDLPELGVGIPGMRQRLRQLGGALDITSNGEGTVVSAVLPLHKGGNNGAHAAGR